MEIDFSILNGLHFLDMLFMRNLNLEILDLSFLSNVDLLGQIDLSENKISALDVTPIMEKRMNMEYGLILDEGTKILIKGKSEEEVQEILEKPDQTERILYMGREVESIFSYGWLRKITEEHDIEWT